MGNIENRNSLSRIEQALMHEAPENYGEKVEFQALHLIMAVVMDDPELRRAVECLGEDKYKALKDADNRGKFKLAVKDAFGDRSQDVIGLTLGYMDETIRVMNGRDGDTFGEIFDNPQVVLEMNDTRVTAKKILREIRLELHADSRVPLIV